VSHPLPKRLVAEAVGTAMLLTAVVGSGIMGERLAAGNVAIALLANSIATGGALVALILTFGPISGAHFNPVVTLADASQRGVAWREVPVYLFAQVAGAFAGVGVAHLMFGLPLFFASRRVRSGSAQIFSEFIATFGLLALIWGCSRFRSSALPFAIAAYIVGAYWFTASTSFANPAVTLARSATDTFAGIRPLDAPAFILAQIAGAGAATALFRWLNPPKEQTIMSDQKRVLILCTGNSARSQMAEGLLRHIAGDRFDVASAGVSPTRVRPEAIEAMRETGIDISNHHSKSVDEFVEQEFDYVITVCDNANEQCPVFPGKTTRIHWSFDDPAAVEGDDLTRLDAFRQVRDEISNRLRFFVTDELRRSKA
jgi:thioredoxin type arsenate reductase